MKQTLLAQEWKPRLKKTLRRAWAWSVSYFSLNRPLDWQSAGQAGRSAPFTPGWNIRRGQSYFYLGILAGAFIAYFVLGGPLTVSNPVFASVESALEASRSLTGILLALLLYPAFHRLGRFDDLRSITGSLLASAMFGFIVPLLARLAGFG